MSSLVKAGCGKTARPVWAADGGKPIDGASSDPTALKPVKAGGAKGKTFHSFPLMKHFGTLEARCKVANEEKEIWELSSTHKRLQTLIHHVNRESLKEEHQRQSGNKAPGVDGVTKAEYSRNLDANIEDLLKRMKSFSYRPKPVRRTYIPKRGG